MEIEELKQKKAEMVTKIEAAMYQFEKETGIKPQQVTASYYFHPTTQERDHINTNVNFDL